MKAQTTAKQLATPRGNRTGAKFKEFVCVFAKMGLTPLLFYLVCFFVLTYPAVAKFSTHFFADGGDGLQNVWNVWWVEKAITVLHQSPWHTQYLHYPYGTSLLPQTMSPFNGFPAIVLSRFLTAVAVYNVIVTFSFVAGGVTAFILAYYLTAAYWPSIAAGFIFTFSNYHFTHAQGHLQLVSLEWIPLFVLLWFKLLSKPTIRIAVGAALVLFLVILCDYYYFFYSVITGVVTVLWYMGRQKTGLVFLKNPYVAPLGTFCLLALASSGALAGSLLLLNVRDPLTGGHSPEEFGLDLLAPFIYGAHWRFAAITRGYWFPLGNANENSVHLGLSVIILLVFVWFKRKSIDDGEVRLFFFILLFFLVLALGPSLHVWGKRITPFILPYAWLERAFPPLKISGVPVRMMTMVFLSAAMISAYGFRLLCRTSGRGRIVAAALFATLCVEYVPAPIPTTEPAIPQYVTIVKGLPERGGVLDMVSSPTLSLLYQTVHEKPVAFGYVSRSSRSVEIKDQEVRAAIEAKDFPRLWCHYHLGYLVSKDSTVNTLVESFNVLDTRPMIWSDGQISLFDLSKFEPVPFEQVGEALANIPVKIQGAWVKDGYYPGSERPPIKTVVMGSWVRSDADTGILRMGPFRTGRYGAIAVPVLTGPVSRGLSVIVVEGRSGDTVAQLSPPPVLAKWRVWKILLPRHDMQLEIVAQDQGAEWGEWLALGMPHALK